MTDVCSIETIGGLTCVVCPEVAEVPAVPEQIVYSPRAGWDSSAHSILRHDGAVYTKFIAFGVGVVCGFANEHRSSDPRGVQHGFYSFRQAGANWWAVIESGVQKTTPVIHSPFGTEFRIERRIGGGVVYFVNNRAVYDSVTPSTGSLIVVACLYASGDKVY